MLSKHSHYANGMDLTHFHFITEPILYLGFIVATWRFCSSTSMFAIPFVFWHIESLGCVQRDSPTVWITLSNVFWDSMFDKFFIFKFCINWVLWDKRPSISINPVSFLKFDLKFKVECVGDESENSIKRTRCGVVVDR